MHIVMVNHGYRPLPPEPADSPAMVIDQLAAALGRRGVSVTAVGGPGLGSSRSYDVVEVTPPVVPGRRSVIAAEVLFAISVRRTIRSLGADVVHYHLLMPAVLGARIHDVPVVFSHHAPISEAGRVATMGWLSPISELLEMIACRRADRVVALSGRTAEFVHRRYHVPARGLSVIPNGVDTDAFTPPTVEPDDHTILCVARIARYKDQATLVHALGRPPLDRQDVRLILAGPIDDTAYASELMRLASVLGVRHRVEILGQVDFGRLPHLYRSAAVVAAPSRAEGMPLALLEAMSCGRAVVASAIPQHIEVGEGAGVLLVPPGDADAMSRSLWSLLADGGARMLAGEAARRHVVQRFGWDSVARRFERLYLDLLS